MPALRYSVATPTAAPFIQDRFLPCRKLDPETFFPDPGRDGDEDRTAAREACEFCPRRLDCLVWSLAVGEVSHGIYGGHTPEERRAMLRKASTPPGRPEAAARATSHLGWRWSKRPDMGELRRLFDAAGDYLTHGGGKESVCQRWRVNTTRFAEAVAITRWAPELVDEVADGWRPFAPTYRHAQAVRIWHEAQAGPVAA